MFGRYHEPLSDDIIITRINQAANILPRVRISLNSNGDYFSVNKMDKLIENGLSDMRVMIYLPSQKSYRDYLAEKSIFEFARKHVLTIEKKSYLEGVYQEYIVVKPESYNPALTIHCENYREPGFGCDRGSSLPSLRRRKREVACYAPFFEINVDFNGMLMPCCNLLSDIDSHLEYIFGSLKEMDVLQAYNTHIAKKFRRDILSVDSLPRVCKYCEYYWPNRTLF